MRSIFITVSTVLLCMVGQFSYSADDSVPQNWLASTKPFQIAGPLYYVGTEGLGVYLIKSNDGLVLLSGAMPQSAVLIETSVHDLGFRMSDVRLLLVAHAHIDHVGTLAALKKLTGGSVIAMDAEADLLKSGGKTDYLFSNRPAFHFTPVIADRLIKDGESVTLGDIRLIAHWTPGHTRGCTTWEMKIRDDGRKYDVVFLDGTGINPGTQFKRTPSYPGIASDYRKTFTVLEGLHPDIFLAYHAESFNLEIKRQRAVTEGIKAWIDPIGYRDRLAQSKESFENLLKSEK